MTTGQHGVTFRDPGDLANVLIAVATNAVAADSTLGKSRAWLAAHEPERWDPQWDAVARPVLSRG